MLSSKCKNYLATALFSVGLFAGCGGGGSGGTISSDTTIGKIVDPYIVGAVLCEDINKNGICESNEQLSSTSTVDGQFTFSSPLTAGSHIIVKTHGLHNGLTYDLNISGVVDSAGEIEVVSPITTLETRGLTKANIISLLTTAGLTGLSEADISSDPMAGLSGKTSITDSELKKLQASLATYGLLKIMSGSNPLKDINGTQLVNNDAVKQIASSMVSAIKNSLNETTFTTIKNQIDGVRTTAISFNSAAGHYVPAVTTDVIIKTAVTVMDRIVSAGNAKCNESDGNVTLALQEANSVASTILNQVNDIGQYYYGLENKTVLSSIPTQFQNLLPTNVASGVANNSGIVVVNADNQLTTRATTKIKNLWGLIDLNGGDLGNDKITIAKLNPTVSSLEITNESNNTTTYQFPNATLDINITSINSGKNKLSILFSNGNEEYLYFYKGRYDAEDDNNSLNGNTDYYFHDIKADNVVANDMFVLVENFNDATRNDDDRWIYMLPNDQNQIDVLHLNASGGYRVDSINYEQYVVSNTNAANAGQDIRTTSSINVRKIDSTKSITGTFLKVVENSQIPFTLSDLNTESIWLHAHYYNPNATYSAVCTDGSLKCDQNSSGNVWVGAQDLHLTLGEYQNQSANYNLANSTYTINNLANDRGYKLLAFWKEKSILGWEYDVNSSTNNNVILGGETKDINGTLADPFTHIKIARKTMFSGQPYYSYSTVTKKDSNDIFNINYHLDTTGTTSYLIYGDVNSTLDFTSTCGASTPVNCIPIKIGGVDDNSTNVTIP